jgi:hypothetical protein
MRKQLIVGQVGIGFTIQKKIHGNMAIGKHSKLEKVECYNNNVSLNKGKMINCFGPIYLPKQ